MGIKRMGMIPTLQGFVGVRPVSSALWLYKNKEISMPYPSKLNSETIVEVAWQMMEDEGVESFSMHKLAAHFKVKTASLYRYYKKTELLRAVNAYTEAKLYEAIIPPLQPDGSPTDKVRQIAIHYRAFALAHPTTYGLMYTNTIDELRPDFEEGVQAVTPFQTLISHLSGEADSLAALRGLLAIMHGFSMLEIAGQLRRGGDLSEAYGYTIDAYIKGLKSSYHREHRANIRMGQ
jgi:AcrR family transcriptional regulator